MTVLVVTKFVLWVCVKSNAMQYGKCSISRIQLLYNNNKYIYILDIHI